MEYARILRFDDAGDDSCARAEWDWNPSYDLDAMTVDMIASLRKKFGITE